MKRIFTFILIASAALLWNGCNSAGEMHECCDGHGTAHDTRSLISDKDGSDVEGSVTSPYCTCSYQILVDGKCAFCNRRPNPDGNSGESSTDPRKPKTTTPMDPRPDLIPLTQLTFYCESENISGDAAYVYGKVNTVTIEVPASGKALYFNIYTTVAWNINMSSTFGNYAVTFKNGFEPGDMNVWQMPATVSGGEYLMCVNMLPSTLPKNVRIDMLIDTEPHYAALSLIIKQPATFDGVPIGEIVPVIMP